MKGRLSEHRMMALACRRVLWVGWSWDFRSGCNTVMRFGSAVRQPSVATAAQAAPLRGAARQVAERLVSPSMTWIPLDHARACTGPHCSFRYSLVRIFIDLCFRFLCIFFVFKSMILDLKTPLVISDKATGLRLTTNFFKTQSSHCRFIANRKAII